MAYSNSTSDRIDELRFRNQQSHDSSLMGLVSPPRNGTRVTAQPLPHPQDGRGGLLRRFTTDSGRVPTIGSLGQRGVGLQEQQAPEFGPSVITSFPRTKSSFPRRNIFNDLHSTPEFYTTPLLTLKFRPITKYNL